MAQTLYYDAPAVDRFTTAHPDTSFRLSHALIIPASEVIYLDTVMLFRNGDYTIQYDSGFVQLHRKDTLEDHLKKRIIFVYYNYLPFTFESYYRHKEYVLRSDSTGRRRGTVVSTTSASSALSNLFGPDLQKSGSIFRGFTVGTNQDLTVNSGFRLQFAGKLSSDVEILAALTDENTPIQPEGNTQTLQELDNVYVQVKSARYQATLGDFYLDLGDGEFNRLSRKLQGAEGLASLDEGGLSTTVTVVGATSRGKFNTNQFPGIEGVQGPYRLYGKNNESNIIVIAGTERVYVDGNLMTRGETNDYSIDYSSSQITFSSKRLITGNSRIVVDFEYTDQAYTRNFFAAEADSKTLSDRVRFSVSYAQEGDDPNSPIDISLSDDDKKLLAQSGAKPATRTGIDSVGVDSLGSGLGQYASVDTLIQGAQVRFYRYAPGTPDARFNLAFTYVGAGSGDYAHELLGQYQYVGPHAGDYLPIVVIPEPQLQQVADVKGSVQPLKDLTLSGELAGSSLDPNRFATGDAVSGAATKFSATYSPKDVKVGRNSIGSFQLSLSDRYVDQNFSPIDRIDDVEFGRKWSIDSTVNLQPSSEEIREAGVTYNPTRSVSIGGSLGTNERGSEFSANRKEGFVHVAGDSLPKIDYTIEDIKSSQSAVAGTDDWTRQNGGIEYALGHFIPSFGFEREFRAISTGVSDSLDPASFSFTTLSPKAVLKNVYGMNLSAQLELRGDNAPTTGRLAPQARSVTQTYGWSLPETRNVSSSVDVVLRQKRFEDQFRLTNGDAQTILVRTETRYTPLQRGIDADVYYEASTERSAQLQRVYYQVQKGEGQYVWVDGNGNGKVDVTDDRDFQLARFDGDYVVITVPTDQLYPVIDVKTSTRLKISPAKFITSPSWWGEKALSVLSTESYVRIEEKSSDPITRQIYLLDLSHFLNPATTILGSQLYQQDLFLFENRQDYSFRFRYMQKTGDGIYSTGAEQSYDRERSIRARLQFEPELSNEINYANKQDNLAAPEASGDTRTISTDDVTSDYSYRPEQNVEVGFKIEVSHSADTYVPGPLGASFNAQSLRTVLSFRGAGQVRFEFSREEILLENNIPSMVVPFALTGGRAEGKTYLWGTTFDYKISSNLQSSLQYTGRSEPGRGVVHTAKAEVRAFF
ncbi:MAG TPA: hypothetical protein VMG34_15650 [Bacteroidota bacterium]|nr:hypothetical protein [Bacteroidota bacterium]